MTKEFEFENKSLLTYLGWGGLYTIVELFSIGNIGLYSILPLFIINGFAILMIESFFGKNLYDSWWKKSFLLNRVTCNCSSCSNWRNDNRLRQIIVRLILALPLCWIVPKFSPLLISNMSIAIEAKILEKKLGKGIITSVFSVIKIQNDEFVKGKKGDYYKVELKSPDAKEKILFPTGRYVIDDLDNRFLIPINKFMHEVYETMDAGKDCDLFVRGNADILGNETFKGNFEKNYGAREGFAQFSIHSYDGRFYSSTPRMIKINEPFRNSALPDLRGRFLQKKIYENHSEIKAPIILEGKVIDRVSFEDRSGYLIMYIDWDSNGFSWIPDWLMYIINILISIFSLKIKFKPKEWLDLKINIK